MKNVEHAFQGQITYNIQFPSNILYFYIAINSSAVNHTALTYSVASDNPIAKVSAIVRLFVFLYSLFIGTV